MKTSQAKQNEPVWDKLNSTFIRIIYLKNGYTLTGYSKKVGRNERRDKVDLLTNWILRDFRNGYLDKNTLNSKITPLDNIYYSIQVEGRIEPVIELFYDYPNWINLKWSSNKKFFAFITRFYDMVHRQVPPSEIVNRLEVRTRAERFDPLDTSTPRLSSMRDLNACVTRLRTEGNYSEEAIEAFYRKYKEKYFNL